MLLQDLRYAVRLLSIHLDFTLVAVLTLALGIGANTAIFSVVDGVLLRPLPYPEPGRLVVVWESNDVDGMPKMVVAPPTLADFRAQAPAFSGMGGFRLSTITVAVGTDAEQIPMGFVTSDLFAVLGVAPLVGRGFQPRDNQVARPGVAVLLYELWQRRFGGDPAAVRRSITVSGAPTEIVGVMPPRFTVPPRLDFRQTSFLAQSDAVPSPEIWLPFDSVQLGNSRGAHFITVVARLESGVTLDAANEQLAVVAHRIAQQFPESNRNWSARATPVDEQSMGELRPALLVLLGAVGFVLLLACANVAHLMLARSVGRRREMAIRAALGAGRGRLARQMLTESLVLALAGGAAGVLLASWGVRLLVKFGPGGLPRLDTVTLNGRALVFTLACSLLAALLSSIAPVLQSTRVHAYQWLKDRSSGRVQGTARVQSVLIAGEAAIALILLIGAALLGESFMKLRGVDPGFKAQHVLTFRLALLETTYPERPHRVLFYEQLRERLRHVPGVITVGAIDALPLRDDRQGTGVWRAHGPDQGKEVHANFAFATPGYIEAMGVPLLRGRAFEPRDRLDAPPVLLVNETAARRLFGESEAVGQQIFAGFRSSEPFTIVGVVGDERHESVASEGTPA